MTTHAERIHAAKERVIACAKEWGRDQGSREGNLGATSALRASLDTLLALEAAACDRGARKGGA